MGRKTRGPATLSSITTPGEESDPPEPWLAQRKIELVPGYQVKGVERRRKNLPATSVELASTIPKGASI